MLFLLCCISSVKIYLIFLNYSIINFTEWFAFRLKQKKQSYKISGIIKSGEPCKSLLPPENIWSFLLMNKGVHAVI